MFTEDISLIVAAVNKNPFGGSVNNNLVCANLPNTATCTGKRTHATPCNKLNINTLYSLRITSYVGHGQLCMLERPVAT